MFLTGRQVTVSEEFLRISGIRRRQWSIEEGEKLAAEITPLLKTPNGTMTLLPMQAIGLREAWVAKGLFASSSVSSGKTLLSFLLPKILNAKRAVIVQPANLLKKGVEGESKTTKAIRELSQHWVLTPFTCISYDALSVVAGKGSLEELAPDVLIFDETHKLKNPKAARTKRVRRYLKANPDCIVCVMSGSTIKRSIKDYAHLLKWALKANAPVPSRGDVLDDWDAALSGKIDPLNQIDPGAILEWCAPGEVEQYGRQNAGRRAFARRLSETPGVICHHVNPNDIGAAIEIKEIVPDYSEATLDAFRQLRKWELPNGQELVEGCEVYRHAREIGLGFYYIWAVPPPKPWLEARRNWSSYARETLKYSRTYDSPDELAKAFPDHPDWVAWKAIRDTYRPVTKLVWIGAEVLMLCKQWLDEHSGVVYVEHTQFGEQLAELAGVPYFGEGGLDAYRRSIEKFDGRACVASINANSEGRDSLKRFSDVLVASPMPNGMKWEQLLGRFHRLGQRNGLIRVWLIAGCREQSSAFWQAMADAELGHHVNLEEPKLLLADIEVTAIDDWPSGPQWDATYRG